MLYLITSGNYSEYKIVAVMSSEEAQDISSLYQVFQSETGLHGQWWSDEDDYDEKRRRVALAVGMVQPEGYWDLHDGAIFAAWLVHEHGFTREVATEINLED